MKKPTIAIPLGDPAGIGPEIVRKALTDKKTCLLANYIVIGDHFIWNQLNSFVPKQLYYHYISSIEELGQTDDSIHFLDIHALKTAFFTHGKIQACCGKAAFEYIKESIKLAMNKTVDAIVTPPIHKEAFKAGDVPFIGHTELFASLTNSPDPLTMFEVRGLRIFFLSRHISLRQACDFITKDHIKTYIKRCFTALNSLGVKHGVMAVAGLNPHSGENGLFGSEEKEQIIPAIEELQQEGYSVAGPIGADSVFYLALQGRFQSVLSLYHDQGHIAAKTLDFERTVSVTCGLPILRTSVDHGTAFDIAGKGIASAVSMMEAIRLAVQYCNLNGT